MRRHLGAGIAAAAISLATAGPAAAHLETPAGDLGGGGTEDIGDPSAPTRTGFGLSRAEMTGNTPLTSRPGRRAGARFFSVLGGGPPHE